MSKRPRHPNPGATLLGGTCYTRRSVSPCPARRRLQHGARDRIGPRQGAACIHRLCLRASDPRRVSWSSTASALPPSARLPSWAPRRRPARRSSKARRDAMSYLLLHRSSPMPERGKMPHNSHRHRVALVPSRGSASTSDTGSRPRPSCQRQTYSTSHNRGSSHMDADGRSDPRRDP